FSRVRMRNLRLRLFRQTKNLVSILLIILLASVALASTAKAQDAPPMASNDQSAETAVQIFLAINDGAAAAGLPSVPIPKEAVPVIQQMVGCALNGTSAGDCAKNIALSTALSEVTKSGAPEAQPFVTCIGGGGNFGDCAEKAALTAATQQLGTA